MFVGKTCLFKNLLSSSAQGSAGGSQEGMSLAEAVTQAQTSKLSDQEDGLVMETKLKIIEILQVSASSLAHYLSSSPVHVVFVTCKFSSIYCNMNYLVSSIIDTVSLKVWILLSFLSQL